MVVNTAIFLKVPEKFNFSHCLKFLNRNALECLHRVEGEKWRKLLNLNGKMVLIQVVWSPGYLKVTSLNTTLTPEEKETVTSYVWEVFDLGRNLELFYHHMQQDPVMHNLCQAYNGLRLMGIPDLFEALCWCIIGQQINLAFAYKLKHRLVQAKGKSVRYQGQDYYLFPTPAVVASIPPTEFSGWQYSASKADYLVETAKVLKQGGLSKQGLLSMTDEESLNALLQLRGIGPWSANYVSMKCLRKTDAYPIEDVGLHNAIKASLDSEEKPSKTELVAFGSRWHPWEAYATFYLWHSLIK